MDSGDGKDVNERSADRARRAKERAARAAERQKRRFGLEDDEDGSPGERIAMMLTACAIRASAESDPYLARVLLTLGVLSAVRFNFLSLKDKLIEGLLDHPKAITTIDGKAETEARRALDLVRSKVRALEIPHASMFFGPNLGFPPLRSDLRFMKPISTKSRIPFGPDFPRFDIHALDYSIVLAMGSDIAELAFKNVPHLETLGTNDERFFAGLENFANFSVILAALGKCALSDWKLAPRSALEQFACIMAEHDLKRTADGDDKDDGDV